MTSSIATSKDTSPGLVLRLPETAFTRSGIAFRPNEDIWHWTDGPFRLHLDFRKLTVSAVFPCDSLKHSLLVFAKRNSASHVTNLFNVFVHFLALRVKSTPLVSVTAEEVSNYAARLKDHEKWRVGTLNVLLQKWEALGLSGVEPDCTQYLRERRKPGNEKGAAVRTRDPEEGPFSEAEYSTLYKAVDAAYGAGEVPRWIAVLTRLLFACGGRISQYASLKVLDLTARDGSFVLSLPQAKTREVHSRVSFKEFDLSPQTGRLVLEYIEELRSQGHDDDAPLFPETVVMSQGPRARTRSEEDLFFGHCIRDHLSRIFREFMDSLAPPTERLAFKPIPVTPSRFRYTFGTRLAEEGASKAVIADRLGHVDLQHVDVYFEASPKIVENIHKAMDSQLAPLAQAFRGRLVEDEEHSTHKGAPGSRIIDFRVSKTPVGSCGCKGQGCGFDRPTACYTCFKFEPWLDAPHEKVLRRLQDERKRWESDERLAAINDDAIRAVQEVIAECGQANEQRRSGVTA
ncbi:site-specific integrase [Paraburkholderia elongata]|uniref:Tyrosine-type recombinase/integrase n=1 Tax=Paraburkholderia elongata TaxID=2675747 RepID=A0A972SNL0_9BURK|nr:site-specific integrase [Paraburkholderia elongata]NPT60055.1 tyrosine-type recombinase/integrase [Paraburkholderia elongata]